MEHSSLGGHGEYGHDKIDTLLRTGFPAAQTTAADAAAAAAADAAAAQTTADDAADAAAAAAQDAADAAAAIALIPAGASLEVEYGIDGATLWHSLFDAADMYMRQRIGTGAWSGAMLIVGSGSAGATGATGPTGPTGSQGAQGPAGENGQPTYTWLKYADTPTTGMSDSPTGKAYIGLAYNKDAATESTTYADYSWSLTLGPQGPTGPSAPQLMASYSSTGTGNWHTPFVGGDLYLRTSSDAGITWSAALRIVGEAGVGGNFVDYIFCRATSAPATPTGTTPAGWSGAPPVGSDPLWMSKTTKTVANVLVGAWSTPTRLDGVAGAPGAVAYTWVKYGTSAAGAGLNDSPTGMSYIGLAYNKPVATESTVASDYTWSLILGPQGPAGADGGLLQQVFFAEPFNQPYNIGDMWWDNHLMKKCTTASPTGVYHQTDWEYYSITADFIAANVAMSAPTITGGDISGADITGGTFHTAPAGSGGILMTGEGNGGWDPLHIIFYSGAAAEVHPGKLVTAMTDEGTSYQRPGLWLYTSSLYYGTSQQENSATMNLMGRSVDGALKNGEWNVLIPTTGGHRRGLFYHILPSGSLYNTGLYMGAYGEETGVGGVWLVASGTGDKLTVKTMDDTGYGSLTAIIVNVSATALKTNITEVADAALPQVLAAKPRRYHMSADLEEQKDPKGEVVRKARKAEDVPKHLGLLLEELPAEVRNDEGYEVGGVLALLFGAVQELTARVSALEALQTA